MNYITSKELAKKWGIGQRRIVQLAHDQRIPGAKFYGKTWLFPEDAIKPTDSRTKTGKAANNNEKKSSRNDGVHEAGVLCEADEPREAGVLSEAGGLREADVLHVADEPRAVNDGANHEASSVINSETADDFRFPNFEFKDVSSFNPPLNKDELVLKAFVECFNSCRFEEASDLQKYLPEESQNRYLRIHALYCGCMLDITLCATDRFLNRLGRLRAELANDFPHKEEMSELLHEIEATLGSDKYYAQDFNLKTTYHYHESFLPRLCNLESFCLTLSETNASPAALKSCELNCCLLEQTDNYFDLQSLHIYLGCAYALVGRVSERDFHLKKALLLAEKYDIFFNLATQYYYLHKEFEKVLEDFSFEFQEKLERLSIVLHDQLMRFSDAIQQKNIYAT